MRPGRHERQLIALWCAACRLLFLVSGEPLGFAGEACREKIETSAPKALGMDIWEYYQKNAEQGFLFAEAMSGISTMALHAVLEAVQVGPP